MKSPKLVWWLMSTVWSVKVPWAWHSPQRNDRKLGFLSDKLEPRNMSRPSKASAWPACRVPPEGTSCAGGTGQFSARLQLILATTLGSRLKLPTSMKHGWAPPVWSHRRRSNASPGSLASPKLAKESGLASMNWSKGVLSGNSIVTHAWTDRPKNRAMLAYIYEN